jgi:hypothetical protein
VVEDVGGSTEEPGDESAHVGGEPVVGDDPVAFAKNVAEPVDVDERSGNIPGRLHGVGQPLASTDQVVGGDSKIADEVGQLCRAAFAFHEKYAVELEGGGVV